ncbi:MAG: 4Fe-4S dicluster domain-containing protein, partial [Sulfuricellaceae bacterium]|nr:4Fe-4S dicluster domain-containing protein [Sulfuricellaceae bacterium]
AIDAHLKNWAPGPEESAQAVAFGQINLNYFEPAKRVEAPLLPPEARTACEEIEGSPSQSEIFSESQRCFSCGNCFACDNCWTLCPDSAVLKTTEVASDGSHYVFDYDYCKGCGLCAHECPSSFIAMQEEL